MNPSVPSGTRRGEDDPARHFRRCETASQSAKDAPTGVRPPGAHRHLFDLDEIGGIPSKGAYPPRSKVAKLPFNGATFLPVALVRSALCLTEPHGAERASYMQNQVLIPALVARLGRRSDREEEDDG